MDGLPTPLATGILLAAAGDDARILLKLQLVSRSFRQQARQVRCIAGDGPRAGALRPPALVSTCPMEPNHQLRSAPRSRTQENPQRAHNSPRPHSATTHTYSAHPRRPCGNWSTWTTATPGG